MATWWIPQNDQQLLALAQNMVTQITAIGVAALNLTAAQLAALGTKTTGFGATITDLDAAKATLANKQAAKDTGKTDLVVIIQTVGGLIKVSTATAAQKAQVGVPLDDTIPTDHVAPPTRPVLIVDTSQRLWHTINFADEGTPTKKKKPFGVDGCEIWFKVGGAPPTDYKQCAFLALDSATPYVATWTAAEAGQTIHYMARWKVGDHYGPWSETVSATLGA